MRWGTLLAIGVAVLLTAAGARANELVVLDAKGVDLAPGAKVDGTAKLTLAAGARLTLVAADGRTIEEWNFEPIAETCANRRRDYFARFVIRIPESAAAGRSHVAVSVTDTLAGKTVETTLPLEVAAD